MPGAIEHDGEDGIEVCGKITREYGLTVNDCDRLLLFSDEGEDEGDGDEDEDDELPLLSLFWTDVCVLCRIWLA